MTTALYRRYRPETFAEMIGQSQVTEPLMTALRGDRVGHAYLFSGPRGCGKTTSARILARCLNCAEGPTDTPCGVCPSCVELSRSGGGSLDVVEIDAASHNGVDDARDLRERATFAPSRDRFKIFILDEAHMVTPQGFNALLKLVEEPPAHVKFIFATTEPEKVLGTIRSRTHHYPFRLVPPAAMLEYVEKLCAEEGVRVEQGVLPLVVRAGGGSPRDTLSLLDQLIAGSDGDSVAYERAVALLGYTHAALLDEIVDALAAGDAAAAFPAVDRVVQTGQDPRRFVDDLLERLRDLIVIAAVGDGASAVLRGIPADEMQRMQDQAAAFGPLRLSHTADIVSAALDDMSGATSPRLHLELMIARVLAPSAGVAAPAPTTAPGTPAASTPAATRPAAPTPAPAVPTAPAPERAVSAAPAGTQAPEAAPNHGLDAPEPAATTVSVDTGGAASGPSAPADRAEAPGTGAAPAPAEQAAPSGAAPASSPARAEGPVDFDRIRAAWPAVLTRLETISRSAWLMVTAIQPLAYDTDSEVLTLGFTSPQDVARFKGTTPGTGTPDHLRTAIEQELGVKVKYKPAPLPAGGSTAASASSPPSAPASDPAPRPSALSSAPVTEWAVAPIPKGNEPAQTPLPVDEEPADAESASSAPQPPVDGGISDEEPPLPGDDEAPDEDEPPYEPPYDAGPSVPAGGPAPAAPAVASRPAAMPAAASSAAVVNAPAGPAPQAPVVTARSAAPDGIQRYGEAVVRQVLGATFVREEPFEPPTATRFS
ncbi:DNA polymerase III subunit gamma and tau [Microbacterium sp. CIAB417]|uniref:DNA polymerase III subunit gamma and tau n=1 Tax=Microbacterium sp. CIAB417 TaxID=2860287 RepID=UPI001FAE4D10|nr:DNA polymerase III subunit gamma and tau [Microbacterium sp. CIAB417]